MAGTALFVLVFILCAWMCARFAPRGAVCHVPWFLSLAK